MSDAMEKVIVAADLIDRFGTEKDWRNKVDLDRLDMADSGRCVLGQTQGNYNIALRELRDGDSMAYSGCYGAFASYDEEWKEYIKAFQPGAVWIGNVNKSEGVIVNTIMYNDKLHVVVARDGRPLVVEEVSYFTSRWSPRSTEPKYVDGRLYHNGNMTMVFMYRSATKDMIRLTTAPAYYNVNVGTPEFYEQHFGPLKEASFKGKTISANLDI